MPLFDARLELRDQSLQLRHAIMEGNEAFGGGGKELGAAVSLAGSTSVVEFVDFVSNTQRGVGAGAVLASGSNASFSFARFDLNRNLGLGAGVLTASAGSRVVLLHSQFRGNSVENQMGIEKATEGKVSHYGPPVAGTVFRPYCMP